MLDQHNPLGENMVYENNPYPSKQGVKYLKGIFDLIFRPDPSDPAQLANDGVRANRDFFNSHKGGLVNYTKRFIGGYEPILSGMSQDSGIYVCDPAKGGCGRADFMYNWQFVDAGLYDSKNWIGTVDPKTEKIWSQNGYPVIARVRCNDYNHCKDCNATFATANKGGGSCIYCSSTNLIGGGCGMEHMAVHLVKEQTVDQINANNINAIKPTKYVTGTVNGNLGQIRTSRPFAFRITCGKLKNDTAITNYTQAAARIPNLEIGYRATSDGINFYRPNRLISSLNKNMETFFGSPKWRGKTRTDKIKSNETPEGGGTWIFDPLISDLEQKLDGGYYDSGTTKPIGPIIEAANAEPSRYPISKMRYAFTYDKKVVCAGHTPAIQLWADAGSVKCLDCGSTSQPYNRGGTMSCRSCGSENITKPFASARPLEDCPQCGQRTQPTNIKVDRAMGVPLIFPRKKLHIRTEKKPGQSIIPLRSTDRPQALNTYTMLLVTDDADDDYSYEVYLDGKYTTIAIPRNLKEVNMLLGIDDDASGSQSSGCPKDPFIDALGNVYNTGSIPTAPPPQGVCELPAGDLILTEELSCDAMNGDYKGDGTELLDYITTTSAALGYPQSGVTFPGFSWIVCEGRTQSCYIGERRRWIDNSVDNSTYRNPATASSGTVRKHPRFLLGPSADPRVAAGTMTSNPKYLFMGPKTHIMMDIFNHTSINMAGGSTSNIAKHTHDTNYKGMIDNGFGGSDMIMGCKTCFSYYTTGMDLAFKNDTNGCGNPETKAWTTVGGAPNLETAWNNGHPTQYFPGVEVLIRRRRFGTITGWVADMPTFAPRRIATYSEAVLHQEINNVKGENGWWFWIHDQTLHDMYQKCDGTYII
jgi:hypothetical protein